MSPITGLMSASECFVTGPLAIVLRMSRIFGMAPLQFKKQNDGWRIQMSRTVYFYSLILMISYNIVTVYAVLVDIQACTETGSNQRASTSIRRMVRFGDIFFVMFTATVVVCGAPARMKDAIRYLNFVHKVHKDLNKKTTPKSSNMKNVAFIIFAVVLTLFVNAANYIKLYFYNADLAIEVLYLGYNCAYFSLVLINLQYAFLVIAIKSALEAINDKFEELNDILEEMQNNGSADPYNNSTRNIQIPLKSVNKTIDTIADMDSITTSLESVHEPIIPLIKAYSDVCEIMKQMNKTYEWAILLRILTLVIHLIISPYYLLIEILTKGVGVECFLQLTWCMCHLISIMIIIEPCHWNQEEISRTCELMVQLSYQTMTSVDPFIDELKKFFRGLYLDKTPSQMGVISLGRGAYAKIMASIATYLIAVMQFSSYD